MVCSCAPAGGLVAGTPTQFPPVFGYVLLSVLLSRTVGTLQADRCRKPESLPPACTPPGTRQPLWRLDDVLAWLEEHREAPAPRRPGRPRKTRRPDGLTSGTAAGAVAPVVAPAPRRTRGPRQEVRHG